MFVYILFATFGLETIQIFYVNNKKKFDRRNSTRPRNHMNKCFT